MVNILQPFEYSTNPNSGIEEQFTNDHLIPWAKTLDPKYPLLNLASGSGVEGLRLQEIGLSVVETDLSLSMMQANKNNDRVQANAINLPYRDSSIGGTLFKDAWVFLNNQQQRETLKEIYRVLKPHGSLLLLSQNSDAIRVYYSPKESSYPAKETFYDDESSFLGIAKLDQQGDEIISVEFMASAERTIDMASGLGFKLASRVEYSNQNPLAVQNRWVSRPGYYVVLTKE